MVPRIRIDGLPMIARTIVGALAGALIGEMASPPVGRPIDVAWKRLAGTTTGALIGGILYPTVARAAY